LQFLADRSVVTKLASVLLVALAALGALAVVAWTSNSRLSAATTSVSKLSTLTHQVDQLDYYNADLDGWQVAYGWDASFMGGPAAVSSKDANRIGLLADEVGLDRLMDQLGTNLMTPYEKSLFVQVRKQWAQFFNIDKQVVAIYKENTPASLHKAYEIIQNGASYNVYVEINTLTAKMLRSVTARAANDRKAAEEASTSARWETLLAFLIGALVAGGLMALVARSVLRPLRRVKTALDQVATGDLAIDTEIAATDEFGAMTASLNKAVDKVRAMLSQVHEVSEALGTSASSLSAHMSDIGDEAGVGSEESSSAASAAEQISASVQSVASATEEMAAAVHGIAGNAERAARVAAAAVEAADLASQSVAHLEQSSREIGSVVAVITAIAEQTRLLALNATIEAARAGDSGRGFAVVAGEVKGLADETTKSTGDIAQQVETIQRDSAAAVKSIEQFATVASEINAAQQNIAAAVEEHTATTSEIGRRVTEAANGTDQVAKNVSRVARTAVSTTTRVNSAKSVAADIAAMSQKLSAAVAGYHC
jgi:methyl-accepting chemotaxis protein